MPEKHLLCAMHALGWMPGGHYSFLQNPLRKVLSPLTLQMRELRQSRVRDTPTVQVPECQDVRLSLSGLSVLSKPPCFSSCSRPQKALGLPAKAVLISQPRPSQLSECRFVSFLGIPFLSPLSGMGSLPSPRTASSLCPSLVSDQTPQHSSAPSQLLPLSWSLLCALPIFPTSSQAQPSSIISIPSRPGHKPPLPPRLRGSCLVCPGPSWLVRIILAYLLITPHSLPKVSLLT